MPAELQRTDFLGVSMAYREQGHGDPVVFLHGNPTSSYLWRSVLAEMPPEVRCLAPDMVGMGDSAKLPGTGDERYRLIEHRRYLDALLTQLGATERMVLVAHDWGAVLAFDWARRHPESVSGIVYLETLVAPVSSSSPNAPDKAFFGPLRSAAGERMVLEGNVFVEQILPAGTLRTLTESELITYRQPYLTPGEDRRPMLTWAREIPIDHVPADVHDIVAANAAFMAGSPIPKLLVRGVPGALLTGELLELCRSWPNQEEVSVAGLHFLPEDSGEEIGTAVAAWLARLP